MGGQPLYYQKSHTSETSITSGSSISVWNETPDKWLISIINVRNGFSLVNLVAC